MSDNSNKLASDTPPAGANPSWNPRTGQQVPAPADDTPEAVDAAVAAARQAAGEMAAASPATRASWLSELAVAVEAESEALSALADEETALGLPRLSGELAGMARALRFYGSVAAEGSYLQAAIDRKGEARPDVRRVNVPLGPVGVFGASNFPFGFGVLGHDSASALAAGCPVVVKAHPAHPRLSARLAEIARGVLGDKTGSGDPFGIVHGFEAGGRLVTHPGIRAVGFTGSIAGGLALWRAAAGRPEVIPVYAEMGTVNSIVVTPSAAAERGPEIAAGFVGSFTLGMGQFCTKPGLLAVPAGSGLAEEAGQALLKAAPQGHLLTENIAKAYASGTERLTAAGAQVIAQADAAPAGWAAAPAVLKVDAEALTAGSPLLEECFGPVALVTEYGSQEALDRLLAALPGSLAAGVHAADGDPLLPALVAELSRRCGRVVVNGWPTGVALGWAQQHGGPWPATSAPATSSVGAAALSRWVRPVAFQDTPDAALPPALRSGNPWDVPRRVTPA